MFHLRLFSSMKRNSFGARGAWLFVAWLGLLANFASASVVRPPEFSALVRRAERVVRVETSAVRSEWRGDGPTRRIVTLVTFRVLEPIVGETSATIELEFLGGQVGDVSLRVPDQPQFHAGDRDILFVENNGRQLCPLVNMMYGRYPLVADPVDAARFLVMREDGEPLRSTAEIKAPSPTSTARTANSAAAPVTSSVLSAAEFAAEIRRMAVDLGRKDVQP